MSARDQMIASIATVLAVFGFAWAVYWLLRRCRLAGLMDAGDGQGGVPPLPRTRPLSLGDLVVNRAWEAHAARTAAARGCLVCSPPFSATAPCLCAQPCGDPGCGALAWQAVSHTEEMEADW